jgi:cytochrome b561
MSQTYTRTAIALHWLIALVILIAIGLGFYMTNLSLSPFKLKLFSWHKWLGVTIFLLASVRLVWRLTHPAPALPNSMDEWEKQIAQAVPVALSVLMFSIPLSGWLMSSAAGFPVVFLGLMPLPDLVAKNKELAAMLKQVHFLLNMSLLALVGLHIGAALKHHFVLKDNVMAQMLPWLGRGKSK